MIVNMIIFFVGLAVYAGHGISVLYLLAMTLLSYLAGLVIPKYRFVMWVSVILQASLLLFAALAAFTAISIACRANRYFLFYASNHSVSCGFVSG